MTSLITKYHVQRSGWTISVPEMSVKSNMKVPDQMSYVVEGNRGWYVKCIARGSSKISNHGAKQSGSVIFLRL